MAGARLSRASAPPCGLSLWFGSGDADWAGGAPLPPRGCGCGPGPREPHARPSAAHEMRPVLLWCFRPGTCKLTLPAPAHRRLLPRAPRNRKRQASRSHRSPRLACRVSPPLLRPPSSQPHGPKPGTVSRVSLDHDRPARPHLPHRGQRPPETQAGRPDPAHPAVAPTAPGEAQPRAGPALPPQVPAAAPGGTRASLPLCPVPSGPRGAHTVTGPSLRPQPGEEAPSRDSAFLSQGPPHRI